LAEETYNFKEPTNRSHPIHAAEMLVALLDNIDEHLAVYTLFMSCASVSGAIYESIYESMSYCEYESMPYYE